jgi:hypothetical protein
MNCHDPVTFFPTAPGESRSKFTRERKHTGFLDVIFMTDRFPSLSEPRRRANRGVNILTRAFPDFDRVMDCPPRAK